MKLTAYIAAWLYLAAILAAQARGPVAPANFRATPGVGPFDANQSGCWVASAKQFRGGPITESFSPIASTDLLSGLAIDYYSGNVVNPVSYAGARVTQFYSRFDAPGDANARAGTFELRGSGNNPALNALTGASYYTGAGTVGNLRALGGLSINQGSGTSSLSEGLLGLTSNTGTGTVVLGLAGRYRLIQSGAGVTTSGDVLRAEAILTSGSAGTITGLNIGNWESGAAVTESRGIYADTSIDVGSMRHFILSTSTSPSNFAGDVALTDSSKYLILTSPNGHRWGLGVGNTGAFNAPADLGTGTP